MASVEWPRRRGFGRSLRGLRISGRRGVLFDGHAEFIESAGVPCVLGRYAFGNRLRALELRSRVEEPALFAAMKLEIAFGTLAIGIEAGRKDGSAIGTASAGDSADHARRARA